MTLVNVDPWAVLDQKTHVSVLFFFEPGQLHFQRPVRNDGFFSNSIKSTVRLKSGELEKLYIKIGLQNENSVESFATFYGLDQRELQVYKTILPTMAQFEEIHLGSSHLKSFLPKVRTFYNFTGYILFLLICKLNIDS